MKCITRIAENKALSVKEKIRVAAYCRVSTASDEQLISLDTQKAHYEEYIKSNNEWEYAGVFYDMRSISVIQDIVVSIDNDTIYMKCASWALFLCLPKKQ